ncbi:MAG: GDP-mannose 4,6-dehydratase [Acidobacteria bacterium]|nr:GDP-mannose 4,6-dehydratase [Acidobacteriota bacterium]
MPACLVTGGAGFIGSNLVSELLRQNWRVRVLDNFSTGKRSHLDRVLAAAQANTFELVEGDIRNRDDCLSACREIEYVFHQAALRSVPRSVDDPSATNEVNVLGTLNVLQAAVKAGVPAATALEVLNASNARSFASMELVPQRALTRAWPKTFKLALLDKDVKNALAVIDDAGLEARLLRTVSALLSEARAVLGEEADHVEIVKRSEQQAGVELKVDS